MKQKNFPELSLEQFDFYTLYTRVYLVVQTYFLHNIYLDILV